MQEEKEMLFDLINEMSVKEAQDCFNLISAIKRTDRPEKAMEFTGKLIKAMFDKEAAYREVFIN